MALQLDRLGRAPCEFCGQITSDLFRREGGAMRKRYDRVCRTCLRDRFSPTTIVHTGVVRPGEWTPATRVDAIIEEIKANRAAG